MDKKTLIQKLVQQGIKNQKVLKALDTIPREHFVLEAQRDRAWENTALPLFEQQTISQPYIVALMTQALLEFNTKKILEIGTGSGYQTAILCQLFKDVYSVERIESLHLYAKKILNELHVTNIKLSCHNGWEGWGSFAPFDGIIVTAAPTTIPPQLIEQLDDPGRMVIPVGEAGYQKLLCVDKKDGVITQNCLESVSFVPLINNP